LTLPYFPEKSGSAQQLDDNFIDKSFERISTVPGFGSEKKCSPKCSPNDSGALVRIAGLYGVLPKREKDGKKNHVSETHVYININKLHQQSSNMQ